MNKLADGSVRLVERYLPSPFIIAILLTIITFISAFLFTAGEQSMMDRSILIASYWYQGFWELLGFTMQMVLILLLGHTLALTPLFQQLIKKIAGSCSNTAQAALLVAFVTMVLGYINWGLCVVFGAILAKQVAIQFQLKGKAINYGLIAAAGYTGMMVWHGGISGSAPLKVAEAGHFLVDKMGTIPINETLLSSMNIGVSITMLILVPLVCYWLGKKVQAQPLPDFMTDEGTDKISKPKAAELESKAWLSKLLGIAMLLAVAAHASLQLVEGKNVIDLNFINFTLLAVTIMLHTNLNAFFEAVKEGIQGVSDVIIQFPFYAGIMGIMKYSGLVLLFSSFFVQISTNSSFPILTFFSAAMVNFFVPSGGGQWAVQGPIIIEAALNLGVSPAKTVMALAYGDQITNMLQPFWALPLLGITGLKAKDILPYTAIFFLLGSIVFISFLLLF